MPLATAELAVTAPPGHGYIVSRETSANPSFKAGTATQPHEFVRALLLSRLDANRRSEHERDRRGRPKRASRKEPHKEIGSAPPWNGDRASGDLSRLKAHRVIIATPADLVSSAIPSVELPRRACWVRWRADTHQKRSPSLAVARRCVAQRRVAPATSARPDLLRRFWCALRHGCAT